MKYALQTTHLELSEADRVLLDKKVNRLDKLLKPPYTTTIRLQHDTHHTKGNVITCTINIDHGKHVFHAERVAGSVQDALDEVIEALQQELKKNHDREIDLQRQAKHP